MRQFLMWSLLMTLTVGASPPSSMECKLINELYEDSIRLYRKADVMKDWVGTHHWRYVEAHRVYTIALELHNHINHLLPELSCKRRERGHN